MPIHLRTAAACLAAPLLLSGCSAPEIALTARVVNGQIVVDLSQDWGMLFSEKKAPCIRDATLYEGTEESDPVVWQIQFAGKVNCGDLGTLTIGRAPPGFAQTTPLSGPPTGVRKLVVYGVGWGEILLTP